MAGKSDYCITYMYEIVKNKFNFVKKKTSKTTSRPTFMNTHKPQANFDLQAIVGLLLSHTIVEGYCNSLSFLASLSDVLTV